MSLGSLGGATLSRGKGPSISTIRLQSFTEYFSCFLVSYHEESNKTLLISLTPQFPMPTQPPPVNGCRNVFEYTAEQGKSAHLYLTTSHGRWQKVGESQLETTLKWYSRGGESTRHRRTSKLASKWSEARKNAAAFFTVGCIDSIVCSSVFGCSSSLCELTTLVLPLFSPLI